jgi:hypothetical protein
LNINFEFSYLDGLCNEGFASLVLFEQSFDGFTLAYRVSHDLIVFVYVYLSPWSRLNGL